MQSDDLMPEHVEPRLDALWDLDHPSVTISNQLVGRIQARRSATIEKPHLINLEELQLHLIHRLTPSITARCQVVQHRTVVALWPLIPSEENAVSGGDLRVALGVGGVSVTDDVGGGESIRENEAIVGLVGGPAYYDGGIGDVGELEDVVAGVGEAVDDNVLDVAVGEDGGGGAERHEDGRELHHFR